MFLSSVGAKHEIHVAPPELRLRNRQLFYKYFVPTGTNQKLPAGDTFRIP